MMNKYIDFRVRDQTNHAGAGWESWGGGDTWIVRTDRLLTDGDSDSLSLKSLESLRSVRILFSSRSYLFFLLQRSTRQDVVYSSR